MTELAARIADGWAVPPSDLEQAAMAVFNHHTATCRELLHGCRECMEALAAVRRVVRAVKPLIEQGERQRLRDEGLLLPTDPEAGPWQVVPEEEINK